jgi:hypothetical protein
MKTDHLHWWSNLRHGGLLLDLQRLSDLVPELPQPLPEWKQDRLRREIIAFQDSPDEKRSKFVGYILEGLCGFTVEQGEWYRGSNVATAWTRRGLTGESLRPNHLWLDAQGAVLPVFLDSEKRIGIGRGKRIVSRCLQWLRQGKEQLALVTNGHQWRIVFAGLDYEAWTEWELEQWLAEGQLSDEFGGFRALMAPDLWRPKGPVPSERSETGLSLTSLLDAINNSRKGQSDLSKVLGERVRQSAELLVDGHAQALNPYHAQIDPQDIYRAAVRIIMRMVVILFAESREGLLPRDNPVYHSAYSLQGLRELLDRGSPSRLVNNYSAWPRILALFRLIFQGASHEALPVPKYGGELFAPGSKDDPDGMKRALYLLENACFEQDIVNDALVRELLDLLTRTKIAIRQGRTSTWMMAPVDFSSLDSEYIGILYEGLLDFELRCGVDGQPIVFLAVGNQPALPLTTLEAMNDKAIKDLFERMKDTSSKVDEEEEEGEEEVDGEGEEGEEEVDNAAVVGEEETDYPSPIPDQQEDPRFTLRARAEQWAQRAVATAGLMKKPRGKLSPEKQIEYDRTISVKARQLITKVVMPGEWYLVRWGGTRKGSGSFYTRPQLAIPTVYRTLRPLAYNPPKGADGQPNYDAPAEQWTPKRPEEILALKICDPACGSGSFLLATLRFLTNALFESLIYHNRIQDRGGQAVLELIYDEEGKELLTDEKLPCRPEDDDFEVRTKAILRRYVVERCIYGVDLDPLAVELCRLSLWIETLDRNLPLTFLNHKIKCGNSLVGAWFDQFLHYPAMAWAREGGDKSHTNGVHFQKEAWTRAISEKMNVVKSELKDFIDGQLLHYPVDLSTVRTEHDAAAQALREIHAYGITQVQERAERYETLITDPNFLKLKDAFDLWCALWFWPPDKLALAPMPLEFASGKLTEETRAIARKIATEQRFFHWELEFPDVFHASGQGFDAILGNPPWENLQPNPEEYFSSIDPLFRTYGQVVKTEKRCEFFAERSIEQEWLQYCYGFKCFAGWISSASAPFGDRTREDSNGRKSHDCPLGDRGRSSFDTSQYRHDRWKQKREETTGYADAEHSFQHQTGRLFTYKLFLEQGYVLLRQNGRLGFIVPSGIYSDAWSKPLRELFLNNAQWEWIFGFENREKVFDIDSRFKFNPVILQKGGKTEVLHTAFMRRNLADWEHAEDFVTEYPRDRIIQFSPNSLAILEIQSERDLEVLTTIYSNCVLLGDNTEDGWGLKYHIEFMMNTDAKLFPPRPKWEEWGYRPDEYSRWIKGPWKPLDQLWAELGVKPLPDGELRCAQPPYHKLPISRADIPEGIILSRNATHYVYENEIPIVVFTEANGRPLAMKIGDDRKKKEIEIRGPALALPFYEGRMVGQFDFSEKGWIAGKGRTAEWREIGWENKIIEPQYLMGSTTIVNSPKSHLGPKIAYMRISSATNSRTMISTYLSKWPAGDSVFFFTPSQEPILTCLFVSGVFSCIAYDYGVRARLGGLNMSEFVVVETATPGYHEYKRYQKFILPLLAGLQIPVVCFAPELIRLGAPIGRKDLFLRTPLTMYERIRVRLNLEVIVAQLMGIGVDNFFYILRDTDFKIGHDHSRSDPKGFWRVDKDKLPEHRHTVLTLVAFHDLQEKIAARPSACRTTARVGCCRRRYAWRITALAMTTAPKNTSPSANASVPVSTTGSSPNPPKSPGANATSTPATSSAKTATRRCWMNSKGKRPPTPPSTHPRLRPPLGRQNPVTPKASSCSAAAVMMKTYHFSTPRSRIHEAYQGGHKEFQVLRIPRH